MLNLCSLLLGLVSWGTGAAAMAKPGLRWLSAASFVTCGAALFVQLLEVNRLVEIGDWSALMDTIDAVAAAALILLAVTTALNLIALFRGKAI